MPNLSLTQKMARKAIKKAGGPAEIANKLLTLPYIQQEGLTRQQLLWRIHKWRYSGIPRDFIGFMETESGVSLDPFSPEWQETAE